MAKAPIDAWLDSLEWKAVETREDAASSDLPHATHEAVIEIAGHKLKCYVLSNGQRVFDGEDIHAFFGGIFEAV